MHTRTAHGPCKNDGQQHAAKQHIQRRCGLRRHYAVIDLHGKENAAQSHQIGDQRSQQDVEIGSDIGKHNGTQPVRFDRLDVIIHTRIRCGLQRAQHRHGLQLGLQLSHTAHTLTTLVTAEQQAQTVAGHGSYHRNLTITQLQHRWQTPGTKLFKFGRHFTHCQASLLRHLAHRLQQFLLACVCSLCPVLPDSRYPQSFARGIDLIMGGHCQHCIQPAI